MKMTGMRLFFSNILIVTLMSGCVTRTADLTILSTRNVSLDSTDLDSLPQTRGVEGKTSKMMLLFIPLGVPHLEDAVEDALEKGNGDVLLDGVVYIGGWWFLIGQNTIKVKGNVVKTRGNN